MTGSDNGDYVFKEGRGGLEFVGDFEGLYKNVADPWQQSGHRHGGAMADYYLHSRTRLVAAVRALMRGRVIEGLEVGCGHGHVVNALQHMTVPSTWTGIDISPTAIAMANNLYPKCKFGICDFTRKVETDFAPASFDVIVLGQVLWYVLTSLETVIVNSRTLLKQAGLLVISQAFLREQRYGKELIDGFEGTIHYFLTHHSNSFKLIEAQLDDSQKYLHDDGLIVLRKRP